MQHSIEVATVSRDAHLSVAWRRGTPTPRSWHSKCRGVVHFDELARESEPADPNNVLAVVNADPRTESVSRCQAAAKTALSLLTT